MDQRIIDLYDSFTHGGMNRRQFLDRLADIAGSSAAALALLPLLQNDYARAAIVPPDDPRLAIDTASYDAQGTRINGYLCGILERGFFQQLLHPIRAGYSRLIKRVLEQHAAHYRPAQFLRGGKDGG